MEENKINVENVMELLSERKFAQLRDMLSEANPIDIAQLLGEVPEEKLLLLYRMLPKAEAADIFAEMDTDEQETLIRAFNEREIREVIEEMYIDDAVDLVEEMPAIVVNKILKYADPETRKEINELLKYPEDSAGSVMTTEYMSLKTDMTVADAFERIRRTADEKEDIYTCYVINPHRKLQGTVSLKDLFLATMDTEIGDLMETNVISAGTLDDQEEVAKSMAKYNLTSIPIVDQEKRLVGIVTVDDAIDVIQEEATEDFEKMAAMVPQDKSYFDTTVLQHVKSRLPWLLILMVSSMLTGIIIEKYEVAFQTMPLLVALMPMLSDTSGNCGSQVSTLIIRGMAVDEIKLSDYFKAVWKELRVSSMVGVILSIVNMIRIYIQYRSIQLSLIVGITLVFCVIVAKLLGCTLPMLAKRLKLDPAIMASPMLTTLVDVSSVWIYFQIATIVLAKFK